MADFDYTTLTTDNSDSNTYTSVADVMKKNYSNLITVEKITASSIPTNKYSATFNEPVIAKSGDSYQADTFQADIRSNRYLSTRHIQKRRVFSKTQY